MIGVWRGLHPARVMCRARAVVLMTPMATAEPAAKTRAGGVRSFVPGIDLASTYQRSWLSKDLLAGLVLTALLVPQGMAYAELAHLPPVTGLYTTVLALTVYAIFGPSRNLIIGPDSALAPMIAAAVLPLLAAGGDPDRAIQLAGMLAILMGLM